MVEIEGLLARLRAAGVNIELGAPDAEPERRRTGGAWRLPPSYRALLAIARSWSATDDDGRGIVVYDAREMASVNRDLVHMPPGVCRYDGEELTTRHLIGFASAHHEAVWCFDITAPDAAGEYPVVYHHQDAPRAKLAASGAWEDERRPEFASLRHWLKVHVEALCGDAKPAWWSDLGVPELWQWDRF
ncbi:MAG TPA: hypothetical protein VFQ53_25275 [Kofleriaceae bacterium]|nr:hypothetical protein [Kofleriaceae bacterium]